MSVALAVEAYMYTTTDGVMWERHMNKPEPDYLCMPFVEAKFAIENDAPAMVAARDRAALRAWWLSIGGTVQEVGV
jgi:hypothetical protein